jgi:cell volume regulation protein A
MVAKWLHLTLPEELKQRNKTDIELSDSIKSNLTEIILPQYSPAVGKQIVQLGLPKTSLIAFIKRNGKYITPNGSTVIEGNDKLVVLTEDKGTLEKVFECFNKKA